jgi:hypothetical protein
MKINLARHAVGVVVIAAVAATAFRVSTAPDRIRERLKTAQSVCLASGGEWVTAEREPVCRKGATTASP